MGTVLALDGMGGDLGPAEAVKGAVKALKEHDHLELILVGQREALDPWLKTVEVSLRPRIHLEGAPEVIAPEEPPAQAFHRKKGSSLAVGLRLVHEGKAGGFVSAGSTGALMAGALLTFGRIPGVHRPALVQVMPTRQGKGVVFLDMGAHLGASAEDLIQWALMGHLYAEKVLGVDRPRVALLNVGVEAEKGTEEVRRAYRFLSSWDAVHFAGNIEGREILSGEVDVVVADGFVGNTVLKAVEGATRDLLQSLRQELMSSFTTKLGALLAKPAFERLRHRFDAQAIGGAPLLGVAGVCVKCHGNSTAKAFAAGLGVALEAVEQDLLGAIGRGLAELQKAREKEASGHGAK
ncbi:MAG: phosphate acyltransferase PlsX [Bacillota bacterium]|nr:phosphate acyltransferase PlsX [Bacillota bacterium]